MLKFMFCPNLTLRSFVSIITIVDIIFFVVCLFGSLIEYKDLNSSAFLGPDSKLYKNIDKNPYKIAEG